MKLSPDSRRSRSRRPGVAVAADLTAASTDLGLDLRIDHLASVATKGALLDDRRSPPTAAADPLALAYTQSFAAGGTACRFRLTFASGGRRLVVLAQANDATALQRWTQGCRRCASAGRSRAASLGAPALPKALRRRWHGSLTAVATTLRRLARAHAQRRRRRA